MDSSLLPDADFQTVLDALTKALEVARIHESTECSLDAGTQRKALQGVDRQVEVLTDSFAVLTATLNRNRNIFAPINRLMNELLVEIWSYNNISDRLVISRVSYRWRKVALAASTLWTSIDLTTQTPLLTRKLLERSGTSLLHLRVGSKPPRDHVIDLMQDLGAGSWSSSYNFDSDSHHPRETHVSTHINQSEFDSLLLGCISLDGEFGSEDENYVNKKTLATPMPNLQRVTLSSYTFPYESRPPSDMSIPFPIFENEASRLRHVSFNRFLPHWMDPIYQHLLSLSLGFTANPASPGDILRILASCIHLRHLTLIGCLQYRQEGTDLIPHVNVALSDKSTEEDSDWDQIVVLPKLQHLHLHDFDETAIQKFLSSLRVPSLDYLYIGAPGYNCFTDEFGQRLAPLLPILQRTKMLSISFYHEQFTLRGRKRVGMSPSPIRLDNRTGAMVDEGDHTWTWVYLSQSEMKLKYATPIHTGTGPALVVPLIPNWKGDEWLAALKTISKGKRVYIDRAPDGIPLVMRIAHEMNALGKLLEQASLGGVELGGIEELEIGDGIILPDSFYRDFFLQCSNVRRINISYNKGIGILTTVVQDQLLPNLTEVYLGEIEAFPGQNSDHWAGLLAEWAESRSTRGTRGDDQEGLQPLERIIVQLRQSEHGLLDDFVKKRIKDALGNAGRFEEVYLGEVEPPHRKVHRYSEDARLDIRW